jgi:hypothetical protein
LPYGPPSLRWVLTPIDWTKLAARAAVVDKGVSSKWRV